MNVNKEQIQQRRIIADQREQLELLRQRIKKAEVTAETNKRLNVALSTLIDGLQQDKIHLAAERDRAVSKVAEVVLGLWKALTLIESARKKLQDERDADDDGEWTR